MAEETLRDIRLYGELGNRFGRTHRLAVRSTSEAIRALCVLLPGFEGHLSDSAYRGVAYACFLGKSNLSEDQLWLPCGSEAIRIAPVLQGRKSGGLFQVVLGAALIASAFFTGGASIAAWGAMQTFAASLGASFFLGGISQMLAPQQKGLSTKDAPDNGASYNFNGPVNTTAQGKAIPILYGRMIIGSAVLSAGYFSEDISS